MNEGISTSGLSNDDASSYSMKPDNEPVSNDWDIQPRSLTKAVRTVIKLVIHYRSGKKIKNFIQELSHVGDLIIDAINIIDNRKSLWLQAKLIIFH
jgi:hypothetical protein